MVRKKCKSGIVKGLDVALRSSNCNETITWKELTNKTLSELAEMYIASPSL